MMLSPWLLLLLPTVAAVAFVPSLTLRTSFCHQVWSKQDDDDEMARKMALVRSLQSSYYKSKSTARPLLEKDTGILRDLPLWRVEWTELPGRSNVLHVHDAIYTNMFETILYGPKPWYFGHLFLSGGSKNLKESPLRTWKEKVSNKSESTVVGTLMRITDYRRLLDGRLILLVQGLERFVISKSVQDLPYSIANVQILPDFDNCPVNETQARAQRAAQVLESFAYQDYEYDAEFALPLEDKQYTSVEDIWGPDLAKVLPFVPYSTTIDPCRLEPIPESLFVDEKQDDDLESSLLNNDETSMESSLLKGQILKEPPSLGQTETNLSLDVLEGNLWTALKDFARARHITLPTQVTCLAPPSRNEQPLSADYPSERRQRRLSFAASSFLENTNVGANLRQAWLETPGTRERLRYVLCNVERNAFFKLDTNIQLLVDTVLFWKGLKQSIMNCWVNFNEQ